MHRPRAARRPDRGLRRGALRGADGVGVLAKELEVNHDHKPYLVTPRSFRLLPQYPQIVLASEHACGVERRRLTGRRVGSGGHEGGHHAVSPLKTAPASGVCPRSFGRLTSAPRSTSARTVSACPWYAASITNVSPLPLVRFTGTPASRTAPAWPRRRCGPCRTIDPPAPARPRAPRVAPIGRFLTHAARTYAETSATAPDAGIM